MEATYFYLYVLAGISLLGSFALFAHWKTNQNERFEFGNRGVLFIFLSVLSWSLVSFYRLIDPTSISIINTITNRLLSMFSNLFMLAALPYFGDSFSSLKNKLPFYRNSEQWLISLLIFFSILTITFFFLDELDTNGTFVNKYIIILIDSIISIYAISTVCFVVYHSIKKYWLSIYLRTFALVVFSLFIATQIAFPVLGFLLKELDNYYYYLTLVVFLVSLAFFLGILISYYSLTTLESTILTNQEATVRMEINYLPEQLTLGFDEKNANYFIVIKFKSDNKDNIHREIRVEYSKLLKPFCNWILFAIAKKNNIKLAAEDISIVKFRMTELWNKDSDIKITQEKVFSNDMGKFELKIPASNITILSVEHFRERLMIRETIFSHLDSFTPLFSEAEMDQFSRKDKEYFLNQKARELII